MTRSKDILRSSIKLIASVALFSAMAFAGTYFNLDDSGNWASCGTCAGAYGRGPNTPHSLAVGVRSPSLDGSSARFSIYPYASFSNALWWKNVGSNSSYHFTYDFYVYITNPGVSQALEFDVNQASNGQRHIFGTECDMQGSHQWRVWGNNVWNSTGIYCSMPAYHWNHVTWEFTRYNGRTNFVAITVNGAKHYVNRSYGAYSSGANFLNAAVQLDGIAGTHSYSIWTDRMSLSAF